MIDMDKNTVSHLPGDIVKLPPKLVEGIRGTLYMPNVTGIGRFNNERTFYAFTVFIAKIMCTYRDFIQTKELDDNNVELFFDMPAFISCHDKAERDFVTHMCESQDFEQFISKRLNEIHLTGKLKVLPFDKIVEVECKKHMRAFSLKTKSTLQKLEVKIRELSVKKEDKEKLTESDPPKRPERPDKPQKLVVPPPKIDPVEESLETGSEAAKEFNSEAPRSKSSSASKSSASTVSTNGVGDISSPDSISELSDPDELVF